MKTPINIYSERKPLMRTPDEVSALLMRNGIDVCEVCGAPTLRPCPCGKTICPKHLYDISGMGDENGMCSQCVEENS